MVIGKVGDEEVGVWTRHRSMVAARVTREGLAPDLSLASMKQTVTSG